MDSVVGTRGAEPPGILITRVRGYNLIVALLFGGRRGSLNKALAAASGARAGDRVLDIGCGPGRFAQVLAETVGPQGEVVGVDPSPSMIEYANRHTARQANCRFELAAAQSLDLPDAAFDVVTSTFAMHHIPPGDRVAAMAHMFRVLRPGGRLLIADVYPTGRLIPTVVRTLTRIAPHHPANPFDDVDVRRYTAELRDIGFGGLSFSTARPWAGYLTAVKPA